MTSSSFFADELQTVPESDVATSAEVSVEEATLLKASADFDVEADADTAQDEDGEGDWEQVGFVQESAQSQAEDESENTPAVGFFVRIAKPRAGNKAHEFFDGQSGRIVHDDQSDQPFRIEGMTENKLHENIWWHADELQILIKSAADDPIVELDDIEGNTIVFALEHGKLCARTYGETGDLNSERNDVKSIGSEGNTVFWDDASAETPLEKEAETAKAIEVLTRMLEAAREA